MNQNKRIRTLSQSVMNGTIWGFALIGSMLFASVSIAADQYYDKPQTFLEFDWRIKLDGGIASSSFDDYDSSPTIRILGEYVIDEQVAVEFGYAYLGSFEHKTLNNTEIDGGAVMAGVVGYSPWIQKHRYFFRLGLYRSDLEAESGGVTVSAKDTDLYGGFGVTFKLNETMTYGLQLEHLLNINNDESINSVMVDFSMSFGGQKSM